MSIFKKFFKELCRPLLPPGLTFTSNVEVCWSPLRMEYYTPHRDSQRMDSSNDVHSGSLFTGPVSVLIVSSQSFLLNRTGLVEWDSPITINR